MLWYGLCQTELFYNFSHSLKLWTAPRSSATTPFFLGPVCTVNQNYIRFFSKEVTAWNNVEIANAYISKPLISGRTNAIIFSLLPAFWIYPATELHSRIVASKVKVCFIFKEVESLSFCKNNYTLFILSRHHYLLKWPSMFAVHLLIIKSGGFLQYLLTSPMPVPGVLYLACLYGFSPLRTSPGFVATVSSPEYAGCCSWQLLPVVPAAVLSRTGQSGVSPLVSQEDTVQK